MNETIQRELHVVAYGQSLRFRLVKYAILIPLFLALYFWKGWGTTWRAIVGLALLGIAVHFLLRWKTNGWKDDWWLYKSLFK